ncbi:MAG: 4-hydroxybutyrate--acetyl-CoA CoA transferase [Spirochaetes bacterium]|nr:4-hydroxybutyrate--acetyl-CoA CoA transferase [Spirochaetota bacterium]MBU0956686.1 4-hydroxybutyrate--acetyl-CoA CoA transferase [Spirochaetota bacterium]
MNQYEKMYKEKVRPIDEAIQCIQSDYDVVVGQCASEPQGTMARLHTLAPLVNNVRVFSVLTLNPYDFYMKSEMQGHFELASWFHAPGSRAAIKAGAGTVTFVPNMLHRAASDRLHARPPEVFIGTCTPPDKNGFVSLSLGITYEKDILEHAKHVILEVNPRLPRTFGDTHLHISQVNWFVEHEQEVPSLPAPQPSDTDKLIGQHIADLVEDGSTIQLGIGGIPNAAALALRDKKDLGVHTEMFVDSMMELYEQGVITNRRKAFKKDKFICTFAMGSRKLYDWLDDNVAVEFQRGSWVNDPAVVARNSRMVSINTCLMVDFTGQVASESIGTSQYSGTGGQSDTAQGAVSGFDGLGKSIIACYASAKGGTVSTIVPTLPEGSAVTLHRSFVDHVVTEHGVAKLRGRTVKERTQALIQIAAPEFRQELLDKAKALGYI